MSCHMFNELQQTHLTGVIWTVLDESRELCKNVSTHVKGLFVQWAEMRVSAGGEERRSLGVNLSNEKKPSTKFTLH